MPVREPDYLDLLMQALSGSLHDESSWDVVQRRRLAPNLLRPRRLLKDLFRNLMLREAARQKMILLKPKVYDAAAREEGRDCPWIGYTMIGHRRLQNVRECIESVLGDAIPGDLIETGVWRGGCSIFMRGVLRHHGVHDRSVWVADSFEGLPRPNRQLYGDDAGWDLSEVEMLKVPLERVKANFARFGLLDEQVRFIQGWFKDSLPNAPVERISVLRLDGDLYESTIDALSALYDRVSPGGFVIVDDYQDWPACRKAVDDFRAGRGISTPIRHIDQNGSFWRVG